ncbi:putative ribonuclease H-like domain-containing protein [Tanacetum coccineum]
MRNKWANKTVGNGVGPVHSRNNVNHQNQFVPQAVLLRIGKVNIPPARPQPVPTGKPKVLVPIPTGRQNRPFLVPTDRGYSPSENPYLDAEDEWIFNSGCSRSMTGNMERRDDFQEFQRGKVTFGGGEAVRTACYVLNRVLVTSPHNKTPYALLTGNIPSVSHFKPFGCHVSILNTSDHLGKFDGKADEGHIVGYSASNRAYRVYNVPNKRVEETMNLRPNKRDKANQSAGTQEASTNPVGTQDADSDSESDEQVIIVPSYPSHNIQEAEPKDTSGDEVDDSPLDSIEEIFQQELARLKGQEQRATSDAKDAEELHKRASTQQFPTFPTGSPTDSFFDDEPTTRFPSLSDLGNNEPSPGIFSSSSYDDEFGADLNNLASTVEVSPVATKQINTIHPQSLIIGDHTLAVQTRSKVNKTTTGESAFISKYAIGTKWILKNKRDARGIVVRNKARLVAQGHRQRRAIDLDKWMFKSADFLGRIDEEVYVTQPKGFMDPQHPKKVYKVVKALYGLHQAPRAWYATLSTFLLKHGYRRGTIDKTLFLKKQPKGLQVQQRPNGIFISQDKYVQEILKKFDLECVRTATTPYEAPKPKSKNEPDSPVNVHLYRSMIAYSDSDYAGANKDRKSTTGGCQFLGTLAYDGLGYHHLVVNIGNMSSSIDTNDLKGGFSPRGGLLL